MSVFACHLASLTPVNEYGTIIIFYIHAQILPLVWLYLRPWDFGPHLQVGIYSGATELH